jgi:5-hydroxyisourate hydrolase
MAGITTHILDTSIGRPAAGIAVTLELLRDGGWEAIGSGVTDNDGRLRTLTQGRKLESGTYRLRFGTTGFFPDITIAFRIDDPDQHYHVPLLLSHFGYSTYRGS